MTSGIDDILAGDESLRAGQEALYKDLHQHPELSHHEHRTARRVAGQLQDAGFTIASGIGGTGVAGVLANGAGPTVLLPAELDALPRRHPRTPENPATLRVALVRSMPDWRTRIWVARCRPRHGPVMQTRASASDVPDATRPSDPRS